MTRVEMVAYLDAVLAGITTRGLVAPSVAKGRLRQDFQKVTEIKSAIEKYVPADQASATQTPLFKESQTRG